MDNNSLIILNELNKGCSMGSEAVSCILEKIEDKMFKKDVFNLLSKYDKLLVNIRKLNKKYNDKNDINDISTMSKIMTWYGIQIRTIIDSTTSKLCELLIQGLNMGIIDGRKLINDNKNINKKVLELIKEYVDIQEEYVEILKNYL